MKPFPHRYTVSAAADADGDVTLASEHLPELTTALPAEFGGPGDRWSPETLLVAAIGDCFVLTFRGVARANKFAWTSITCEVAGTVDRLERAIQFTDYRLRVRLRVPEGTSQELAHQLLTRTEQTCLISNSFKALPRLEATVDVESVRAA
jgi:organic hydroperoxide reductase OsmC/OhrA